MTLRTTKSEFTENLLSQMQQPASYDLTISGPLFDELHPRLIKAKLDLELSPDTVPEYEPIFGWHYSCFKNLERASLACPDINLKIYGKPWALNQFLNSNQEQAIIDFSSLGTIILSKTQLEYSPGKEAHHHLLPIWIKYALSPELWGPQGKWIRFHSKLHQVFSVNKLLMENDLLGYYPLIEGTEKLEKHGFKGTHLGNSYVLALPWTFSLTALDKLEKIIQQEF